MVWNQRRDLYVEVLLTIADFRKLLVINPVNEAWKDEYKAVLANFRRLLALAHIFWEERARKAFVTFFGKVIEFEILENAGDIIKDFEIALIIAARKDLGVNLK